MELAENIEALVAPKPTLKEDHEKIQRYDGNTKAPETPAPCHYKHNEGVVVPGRPVATTA